MLLSKKSLVDTKAAVPYSALLRNVLWSTCGDVAPKKITPVPPKFFTVNPCTVTGPTGVTRLPFLSMVPWMQKPLMLVGSFGSKHGPGLGADEGGTMIVAPWPAPTRLRLLVTSTLSWKVPAATE